MFPLLPVLILMLVQGSSASGGSLDAARIQLALQAVHYATQGDRGELGGEFVTSDEAEGLARAFCWMGQNLDGTVLDSGSDCDAPQDGPSVGPRGFETAWSNRAGPASV